MAYFFKPCHTNEFVTQSFWSAKTNLFLLQMEDKKDDIFERAKNVSDTQSSASTRENSVLANGHDRLGVFEKKVLSAQFQLWCA